jgi:hypothetical protein
MAHHGFLYAELHRRDLSCGHFAEELEGDVDPLASYPAHRSAALGAQIFDDHTDGLFNLVRDLASDEEARVVLSSLSHGNP